jgi:hypothetical protein
MLGVFGQNVDTLFLTMRALAYKITGVDYFLIRGMHIRRA